MKIKSIKYFLITIIFFVLQLQVYKQVENIFYYWGFQFNPSSESIILSFTFLFISTSIVSFKAHDNLKNVFMKYWHLFVFLPNLVLLYSTTTSLYLTVLHLIFILTIKIIFLLFNGLYLRGNILRKLNINNLQTLRILFLISIILFIPFALKFSNFDIRSFNLTQIYDVRVDLRSSSNILIGYLKEPFTRVVVPLLIILGLIKNKRIYFFIGVFYILFVYSTTGALKSIIVIIPLIFLFIRSKTYSSNIKIIQSILFLILIFAVIETFYFKTYFLTDLPNRRLFFVPGLLEEAYLNEFQNNLQFYKNNILSFLSTDSTQITKFIGGKYFGRPEMNANIGVVVDGYINLGLLGVILHATVVGFSITILNTLKFNPIFMSILFVYFYYLNTSFIGTLYLTHGFLFLLIFSYVFLNNYESESRSHLSKL